MKWSVTPTPDVHNSLHDPRGRTKTYVESLVSVPLGESSPVSGWVLFPAPSGMVDPRDVDNSCCHFDWVS